jgi:hypothetical protein
VHQKTEQEELMVRYLLGELPDEERSWIEEKFFIDNEFFEQLLSVEGALVDEYVRGELSPHEHERFEKAFLSSPQQQSEIEIAREVINSLFEPGPAGLRKANVVAIPWSKSLWIYLRSPNWSARLSLASLALIAVLVACVLVWNLNLQSKIGEIEAKRAAAEQREQELKQQIEAQGGSNQELAKAFENERTKREQLEREMADLRQSIPGAPPIDVASIVLNPDSVTRGGGEIETIYLRPGTRRLRIRINLDKKDSYKSYGGVIRTFNGQEIWREERLPDVRANTGSLVLTLPANLFANEDYRFTLTGQTESGDIVEIRDYFFRVRR